MNQIEMANILYCINTLASEDKTDEMKNIETISYNALDELMKDGIYPDKSSFDTYMKYFK